MCRFEEKVNLINGNVQELINTSGTSHNTLRSIYKGGKGDNLYEITEHPSAEINEKPNPEEDPAKSTPSRLKSTMQAKVGVKVSTTSPVKSKVSAGLSATVKGKSTAAPSSTKAGSNNPSSQELFSMLKSIETDAKKQSGKTADKFSAISIGKKK